MKAIKIPNFKHQITNKSQISIFNDQRIHHNRITSFGKPGYAGDDTVGYDCGQTISLENLNLGHWNLFEIWLLVFGIFMTSIKQVIFINYGITYLNDGTLYTLPDQATSGSRLTSLITPISPEALSGS